MRLSNNGFRGLIAAFVLLAVAATAFADTLRLKDGSIIKGKVTSFGGGKFVIAIGEGSRKREMTFLASEVESISFDEMQPTVATRTAAYEPPARTDSEPNKIPPARVEPTSTRPATANSSRELKPIEWRMKVTADSTANGWTNTGWVVRKGQRVRITGDGKVSLGRNRSTSPAGDPAVDDPQKLLKNVATGALIAVIGDDNNDFIYIGSEREFVATRDGALFLGINEGNLDDNSGHFDVKIEIIPE